MNSCTCPMLGELTKMIADEIKLVDVVVVVYVYAEELVRWIVDVFMVEVVENTGKREKNVMEKSINN